MTISKDTEAVRLWHDLTSGRVGIKRHHDERGRRVLVLKRPSKTVPPAELSERERRAMGYRAFGHGYRQIADELGVSTATAMTDLARARRRLGVASDLELPAILAAGLRKAAVTERGPRRATRPPSSKLRRREIWREALSAPRGLRREPPRKAGEHLIISFPISDVDWRQGLSPAEVSVAEDVLVGTAGSRIAARRGTAVRTIVNQMASVFRKLGVSSRLELSLYVLTGRHAE
ncbi:MAG: LuxR C-terminal-related transcriptional regulator [Polyangiaceae bacterium]